jgi:phosphatidate cytidylyltransferase
MKKQKKHHDLPMRTLVYGIITLIMVVLIVLAQTPYIRWVFTGAVAAIAGIALWEFYQLGRKKGLHPAIRLGVVSAICYVFAVFFKMHSPQPLLSTLQSFFYHLPEIVLGLAFFACFVYYTFRNLSPILNIANTYLGLVYIAVPLGLIVRIMYFFVFGQQEDNHYRGIWWLVYLIFVTKSADMGGYFVGRLLGKHKLARRLSPNKTYEGAIGGLLCAILVSLLICFLGKTMGHVFAEFSYMQAVWLGAVVGIFGQLGDLAESLLKRDANVKDSNTIPGIGGMLDMIDSLLLSAPVVYMFLRIHYT